MTIWSQTKMLLHCRKIAVQYLGQDSAKLQTQNKKCLLARHVALRLATLYASIVQRNATRAMKFIVSA
jgi:hypothetical protein